MNEKLLSGSEQPKSARIVSNILYDEVKKHDANRHLLVVFDEDFVAQQQPWDSETFKIVLIRVIKKSTINSTNVKIVICGPTVVFWDHN